MKIFPTLNFLNPNLNPFLKTLGAFFLKFSKFFLGFLIFFPFFPFFGGGPPQILKGGLKKFFFWDPGGFGGLKKKGFGEKKIFKKGGLGFF